MATSSALGTLIELATKETDDAAKRLGVAMKGVEDAEQKLALLNQYRDDYMVRFQNNLSAGLSAMAYANYQQFIGKLDQAIQSQQLVVRDAKIRVDREKEHWQSCERKRMSYGTLADRAEKVQLAKENKRDQKQMDEHAARRLLYKR
ncbi:MAG: flagellar export protein FliJ [Oxalicibacterium faecigallinarum]|uniref:Flagellar FliJ protein n=1 Tax=Oxalicibacterium faecigallinarum TaxID=573741 RepID=A0A8J3AT21_9BURK|nr:flagellar export protein FliJ [Oxalicibacterium faecigallinarum]MDQ7969939.1 flagellar export protein FliJ [Oxalicibacterium faecigallinarum]GGI16352.1 flagellar FliJ protein [Oxalicibacterium faecigallinarum]